MNEKYITQLSRELNVQPRQVQAAAQLLADGATIPFIARYRKEATGTLDEVAVTSIRDRLSQWTELDARREAILKSLRERNLLCEALEKSVRQAETMTALEDSYQPFRPKRRTRATMAREKGLEPLADLLWRQAPDSNPVAEAAAFVSADKGVEQVEDALAGARDILAERISDDPQARDKMRRLYQEKGVMSSRVIKGKETEGAKYKDYFDWNEPIEKAPSHRILAVRRGEKEGILSMRIAPPEQDALNLLESLFVNGNNPCAQQVRLAAHDSYKRLLGVSMETETRLIAKKRADAEAIDVFAANLRELLLTSPLGSKNVLAIDPGFRTGCKVICLDRHGKLLHNDVVYPDQSDRRRREAGATIAELCKRYRIDAIAIGNGTAGRETEAFVRSLGLPDEIAVVMVNESGASIYSASDVAREEFPDQDITVRGAVSIGRRLMDPLAELVKIDPKSIGVGQYQHDVDQGALKQSLDDVVVSCVNAVGVEINTASKQLLAYVSGLGPQLADNIVAWRNENGGFGARNDLKKVPRLGPKTYEQAAGFLRIRGAKNPLDASAVHPESYSIVKAMVRDLGCSVAELMSSDALRKKVELEAYQTETVGMPTLRDIMNELAKPGRDPRKQFELFSFAEGVKTLEDLTPGMKLPGVVTNVTAFGAFVDIGVHQDGLVHISQLADTFVKDPSDLVKVQQRVQVTVLEVDLERKRISLSMKSTPDATSSNRDCGHSAKQERPRQKPGNKKPERHKPPGMNDWFTTAMDKAKRK